MTMDSDRSPPTTSATFQTLVDLVSRHDDVDRAFADDLEQGRALFHSISRIREADRRVCDNRNRPGRSWTCSGPFARVEGQPWTNQGDVDDIPNNDSVDVEFDEVVR